jgi:hypothetical protein
MAPPEFVSRACCPVVAPFKERPILFSTPMVRALLGGTKTQTRRVVKPQPTLETSHWDFAASGTGKWMGTGPSPATGGTRQTWGWASCPYGQPGDRLWVRETWNWFDPDELPVERQGSRAPFTGAQGERTIPWVAAYAADGPLGRPWVNGRDQWRPSIHMPRWASRIDLEVTSVRVERLQQISEADSIAEGAQFHDGRGVGHSGYRHDGHDGFVWATAKASFMRLWDSINAAGRPVLPSNPGSKRYARVKAWLEKHPDTSGWDANPWVWVVEFRRLPR